MKTLTNFLFSIATLGVSAAAAEDAEPIDYHGDVAPLLRQYCAGCHNDEDFEGDFSVEYFADVEEGGSKGVMLRSGDPAGSYLIKLLTGGTEEPMPPADEPQPSAAEVEVLKRWISEGAHGPAVTEDFSLLSKLTVPDWAPAPGEKPVTAMAATPDGRVRAEARFGRVGLSVAADASGVGVMQLNEVPGKITALHFAPGDPSKLVTASGVTGLNGVATLWDLRDGSVVREFGTGYHRDLLYDAEFSPDGKILATAGYDAKIALWNVATGEQLRTIEVHNGAIFDLAFSPDGTILASASADETVKLWRVSDGERMDTLNEPQGEVYAVAFSPDGRFVLAGGADKVIRMWRLVSKDKPRINPLVHARFAHEQAVVAMAVGADGKWMVSSSDDRSIKLWSLPRLEQRAAWNDQPDVAAVLQATGQAHEFIAARMDGGGQFLRFDPKVLANAPVGEKAHAALAANTAADVKIKSLVADEKTDGAKVELPVKISGVINSAGDADDFRFSAKAGAQWVIEVSAASAKVAEGATASPLDSMIEVLDAQGDAVERVRLQAVRDSWFTFRGKDSTQSGDFRVQNWRDMELNDYLYCNGEVVKLWLDPRGPDSGFNVYPGSGDRWTYFGTSGLAHPLGEPCYLVRPIPAGQEPVPNGLPLYTIYYENDDDPARQLGSDSKLFFTAPADGEYVARIRDVRGFGGENFSYDLTIRPSAPDFRINHSGAGDLKVAAGSGREFVIKTTRMDHFDGPIRIDVEGLPPGFRATTPLWIEREQVECMGAVFADGNAPVTTAENMSKSKLIATATISGKEVRREVGTLGKLMLDEKKPQLFVEILPDGESGNPVLDKGTGRPVEMTIHPGETITAIVKATRLGFEDRVQFGKEDSGRNLAHGLIIDNIGLSGLMLHEGQTQQKFFITAKDWVPASERWFFLRCGESGGHTTQAIRLKVVPEDGATDGGKVAASGQE